MIHFRKLRLNGFKSFVDRTELDIDMGLTGIVGPNGCGKSNLVEALRWVMGETSAKRMRGSAGGMEDVIFNGTSSRPARNFAEVTILLDNSTRAAPAAYNGADEVEITRRIERDRGSLYKINGKTSRARDVQMLFADTVTGANSPALVSQGRVTAMINAKPQERRLILEESAGVSGLYVRRHEAELRLRAADTNLQRLEDLVAGMDERFQSLKKQARQSLKYKNLSAQIRQMELSIADLEWRLLQNKIRQAEATFAAYESQVAAHMITVTQLTKTQGSQSQDLPALRQHEAEAAAALQARKIALQRLEDLERDLDAQLSEAKQQKRQIIDDRAHEQQVVEESTSVLTRLDQEQATLVAEQEGEDEALAERKDLKERVEEKVRLLEKDYEAYMHRAAEVKARRQELERRIASDESQLLVAQERQESLKEELETARGEFESDDGHNTLKTELQTLERDVAALREDLEKARAESASCQTKLEEARAKRQELERFKSEIDAEIKTLKAFVHSDSQNQFRPVLDDVRPEKGFEKALSRALGDTLMASTDDGAPMVWTSRVFGPGDLPALPADAKRLEPHVQAPAQLKNALALIGVVDDEDQGNRLAKDLAPGQALVSMTGAYWRWDGLHIRAAASDRHALLLQQKNRLQDIEKEHPSISSECEKIAAEVEELIQARQAVNARLDQLQSEVRGKEAALSQTQAKLNTMTEQRSGLFAKIARLEEALAGTAQDIADHTSFIAAGKGSLEEMDRDDSAARTEELEKLRDDLAAARAELQDAIRKLDMLQQEQNRKQARLHAIADERVNMQNRAIRSRERLKELDEREQRLEEKLNELENRPKTIVKERETLLGQISTCEKDRQDAADKLAAVENELGETNKALKSAEGELGAAREARASAQALLSAAMEQATGLKDSIAEHFGEAPEGLAQHTGIDPNAEELPDIEAIKSQKEKMIRDRDNIGPVNLRADAEAEELEKQLNTILSERNDLMQAIEELRGGIQTLNKEARERLMRAFDQVNNHFKDLFLRLFNGGYAHLALIESDDPLESGLEIFAQPPGKTLQSLSLLSGGEQTLASIALIFAMFLTNPSPICVLDEIDAPLDDANVDRVCDLLDEIAERGETRFLVITHHRLTMARMDRLYGVTMAERGVSQLVSVDLNRQIDFLEAAE